MKPAPLNYAKSKAGNCPNKASWRANYTNTLEKQRKQYARALLGRTSKNADLGEVLSVLIEAERAIPKRKKVQVKK